MTHSNTKNTLALIVTLSLSSLSHAADWTIVQDATVTGALTATQGSTSLASGGEQSINDINLDATVDTLATTADSTQTATLTGGLTMTQGDSVSGATQAVNNATALTIGGATTSLTQTTSFDGALVMSQDDGGGLTDGNNVQAVNNAVATTIAGLDQTVNLTTTGSLTQAATMGGSGNQQAINRAEGTITGLNQDVTAGGAFTMDQLTVGTGNLQAANLIDIGSGSITTGTTADVQTFTGSDSVTMTQEGGGTADGLQALNAIVYDVADADSTVQQSFTVALTMDMSQDNTLDARQAGNYIGLRL